MKNTVLITGGSHAELPLIDALHRLGYHVISTGMNTDGLGHRQADLYIPADFSDRETMLALARKHRVAGIVSGCEKRVLPVHDPVSAAETVHHKDAFRRLLRSLGLPCPAFRLCKSIDELQEAEGSLKLPVVVKPTDLTGGKGVAVCRSWQQAQEQFFISMQVTREASVLAEEYIEGANHGVSLLLRQGKVCFSFFDNEEYYLNPYLVSGAYSPSDLSSETKSRILHQIETVAGELKLCDGLFHCQCIVNADGTPFLIDPCRRAPGDLYIRLVSYATGFDYPMAIVKSELGLPIGAELNYAPVNRNIARECMMTDRNGRIEGFTLAPEYEKCMIDKLQWGAVGDRVEDFMKYKAGIVFFEFSSEAEMREKMKDLYHNMQIQVRSERGEAD